jgi:hypothetical protein
MGARGPKKGSKLSEAHKKAIGDALRGGTLKEAHKRKISRSMNRHWARVAVEREHDGRVQQQ